MSRWTSFIADTSGAKARVLHEEGNAAHRARVEHNGETLLVHLSGEDGDGWTVLAVDRATRHWAVAQSSRQLDAARDAFARLYEEQLSGPRDVGEEAASGASKDDPLG